MYYKFSMLTKLSFYLHNAHKIIINMSFFLREGGGKVARE